MEVPAIEKMDYQLVIRGSIAENLTEWGVVVTHADGTQWLVEPDESDCTRVVFDPSTRYLSVFW